MAYYRLSFVCFTLLLFGFGALSYWFVYISSADRIYQLEGANRRLQSQHNHLVGLQRRSRQLSPRWASLLQCQQAWRQRLQNANTPTDLVALLQTQAKQCMLEGTITVTQLQLTCEIQGSFPKILQWLEQLEQLAILQSEATTWTAVAGGVKLTATYRLPPWL